MDAGDLPVFAAWRQLSSREGFEVTFFRRDRAGFSAIGQANGVADGEPWALRYRISFDQAWVTRSARLTSISAGCEAVLELTTNGRGEWLVDRLHAPQLDGCLDLDLDASVFTNALPVHRLGLRVGELAEAPAAYVRVLAQALRVERLQQTYERLPDRGDGRQRYEYSAPAFDFAAELTYDSYGLLVEYPGMGIRSA